MGACFGPYRGGRFDGWMEWKDPHGTLGDRSGSVVLYLKHSLEPRGCVCVAGFCGLRCREAGV